MKIFNMRNFRKICLILFSFFVLTNCESVSKKIDETAEKEKKELTKWLNKNETELKASLGQPDKIEFLDTRNRNYVYVSKKYKISCERKFEISPKNVVVGFSSKNCF